jgi:hypothetical protein
VLLGTNNTVIYGARNGGGGAGDAPAPGTRRLEMLAALWARQTGHAIVVSPGERR